MLFRSRLALAARKAYIEAGGKLLTADEINEEVRQRRGGVSELGLRLMAIRQCAIAGAMKLDSVDDILDEVREGRAGAGAENSPQRAQRTQRTQRRGREGNEL